MTSHPPGQSGPPQPFQPPVPGGNGMATASFILGIISIPAGCLGGLGIITGLTGLILGLVAIKKPDPGKAKTGIILSSIGLALGLIITIAWFVFVVSGLMQLTPDGEFNYQTF